jgi:hypothetical protein
MYGIVFQLHVLRELSLQHIFQLFLTGASPKLSSMSAFEKASTIFNKANWGKKQDVSLNRNVSSLVMIENLSNLNLFSPAPHVSCCWVGLSLANADRESPKSVLAL